MISQVNLRRALRLTLASCCLGVLFTGVASAKCEKERTAHAVAEVTLHIKGGARQSKEYSIYSASSTASSKHISCKAATVKTNNELRASACGGAVSKVVKALEGQQNAQYVQTLVCREYSKDPVSSLEYITIPSLTAKCIIASGQSFFDLKLATSGDLVARSINLSHQQFTCVGKEPKPYVIISTWPAPAK